MIEVNNIVRVKKLDYSAIPVPTGVQEKKKHKELIKQYHAMSGRVFIVKSKHTVEGINFVLVENLEDKAIKIGEDTHSIVFKEDEVEVLDKDYLNNCCIESLYGSLTDSFLCRKCNFGVASILSLHK